MLTDRETRLLLAHAMAYDARIQPGDANVAAWAEAAKRGRWTYDEALEAVHDHYAQTDAWLMPGLITQAIKASRQDAAMRAAAVQPDPVGQSRRDAILAGAFRDVPAIEGEPVTPRPSPLTRPCPFCHAGVGQHCTRAARGGSVRRSQVHPSRQDVAS